MPQTLKFSITPLNSSLISYNFRTGEIYYRANLDFWGVMVYHGGEFSLSEQYNQNKIAMYAPTDSPAPTTLSSVHEYPCARMMFQTDATTQNQYLLKYHVKGIFRAKAAFYLNGNFVGSQNVDGDDIIPIQVNCPTPLTRWYAYMLGIGRGWLVLKKIECYIS